MRVLVLGGSGMLGSTVLRVLRNRSELDLRATVRDLDALPRTFREELGDSIVSGVTIDSPVLRDLIMDADVVLNAVGVIKQDESVRDAALTVRLNALLPHELAEICVAARSRLVHVSTDCVFSGRRGGYSEDDVPDPIDFYGRSKLLGECESPALTLRTSIVGHELRRHGSLIDWFLSQPQERVRGYVNAIYSGITTEEFARLLADVILPRPELSGLYHVASAPISKFDLLDIVARQYGWLGTILPFEDFYCDRSMVADRLFLATGYRPPAWGEMISDMYVHRPPWAVIPGKLSAT